MAYPLIPPKAQFFDSSGAPLASGTVEVRDPDTDSLIDTYPTAADADAQTNANANPVVLDSRGEASIFLENSVDYKLVLKDSSGTTIWTVDDIQAPDGIGASNVTYSPPSGGGADTTVEAELQSLHGKVEIAGLQPERVDGTTLRIFPGYCSDGGSDPIARMELNSSIDIDLTTTGALGLDTGTASTGTDYFVYMIKNPTTGDVSAVVSAEISTGSVTLPSGYTLIRKLPWGFVYLAADGTQEEGIPAFHIDGWPLPTTIYTDMDDDTPWEFLTDGTATTFTDADASALVPDNARMVLVHVEYESTGSAGTAYLRVTGTGGNGSPIGYVPATSGYKVYGQFWHRFTSARVISYKVDSGTKLTLRVSGYAQTERS